MALRQIKDYMGFDCSNVGLLCWMELRQKGLASLLFVVVPQQTLKKSGTHVSTSNRPGSPLHADTVPNHRSTVRITVKRVT